MGFEDNPDMEDQEGYEMWLMDKEIHDLKDQLAKAKQQHAAFVTHVRVACTCLSAPLFLDQEGNSDVHEAARQTLKYLREAIEKDQGEE